MEHSTSCRAFTLIELIFVIAVLSITLSIAIPLTNAFVQNQAKEASRQSILSALRFARATAINSTELTTVCSLNPSGKCRAEWADTLSVFHDTNSNGIREPGERLVRTIKIDLSQWSQKSPGKPIAFPVEQSRIIQRHPWFHGVLPPKFRQKPVCCGYFFLRTNPNFAGFRW